MSEFREVTRAERDALMSEGVFDINGMLPFHPGYTGIHRHRDGTFWDKRRNEQITDLAFVAMLNEYVADPDAFRAKQKAAPAAAAPEDIEGAKRKGFRWPWSKR